MIETDNGRRYYATIIENHSRRSKLKLKVLDFMLEVFPAKILDADYNDLLLKLHRGGYKK